jgi:hypothetical protein
MESTPICGVVEGQAALLIQKVRLLRIPPSIQTVSKSTQAHVRTSICPPYTSYSRVTFLNTFPQSYVDHPDNPLFSEWQLSFSRRAPPPSFQ